MRVRGLKAGHGVPKLERRDEGILDRGDRLSKGTEVIRRTFTHLLGKKNLFQSH